MEISILPGTLIEIVKIDEVMETTTMEFELIDGTKVSVREVPLSELEHVKIN